MNILQSLDRTLSGAWKWINGFDLRLRLAVAILLIAGGGAFSLFAGFMIGKHDWFPSRFFTKIDLKLYEALVVNQAAPKLEAREQSSALLDLKLDVGMVQTARTGPRASLGNVGGGLTSFGDDVLLLIYDGDIVAASSPRDIRTTGLSAPDNHRDEFIRFAESEEASAYQFYLGYLRYNDLEYFSTANRHGLVASYTEYHADRKCVTNTLATLDFPTGAADIAELGPVSADEWKILYRSEPCLPLKTKYTAMEGHMAGGRIVIDDSGHVYLANGDFHFDGMRSEGAGIAQDPDQDYGKVMRIDLDTGETELVSLGHRNPQGVTRMPDGRIVIVEHGPSGGDEVNILREGANYGWPLESYGITYSGGPLPDAISFGRHDTFTRPVFAWVPSVATSTATTISGFDPAWDGDLLVGSLAGQSLFRLRPDDDGFVYSEEIPIGSRIRDVHQHTNGKIVIWTDNEELIFVSARPKVDMEAELTEFLDETVRSAALRERSLEVINSCAECHSLAPNVHDGAPSLAKVFDDPIASTPFAGYSDALKEKSGRWTREALTAYLTDPQGFASGTIMPDPALDDPELVAIVVDYLDHLNSNF